MGKENRTILIGMIGCPECARVKNKLKPKIDSGEIILLELVEDSELHNEISKAGINTFPTIVGIHDQRLCFLDLDSLESRSCLKF